MARTKTYDIDHERDRLQREREETADEAVELEQRMESFEEVPDDLAQEYQQTLAEGHKRDRYLTGLEWALDPPTGASIDEITLSALTAGDEQWVSGRSGALADQLAREWGADADGVDGGRVLHVAAVGVADCPRFEGSPDPESRTDIVRGWHPSFVRWVADRVDNLSTPEVEGKNFAALLKDRRATDAPDDSGADSS